ncbi:MAG: class I SAM-dependent methyltransferase, partial [Ignavibacteria bacterium]|nr:class I SAM-dependent methyltransferase [Ignavibacteria bacterium]
ANPNHPNYLRWQKSKSLSKERGMFVKSILEKETKLKNQVIVDIGSGYGGTILNLSNGENLIISIEKDLNKLKFQREQVRNSFLIQADVEHLPLKECKFNIIILQDIVEHFENFELTLRKIVSMLRNDGIIYLSTPNKFSIFNILSNPHWGFPFVALLRRTYIKNYFIPTFRKSEINRFGIAELKSLNQLIRTFAEFHLNAKLHTNYAVEILLTHPERIIWSSFHFFLLKVGKVLFLDRILRRVANDKFGLLNRFFTPTFYFTLKKLSKS